MVNKKTGKITHRSCLFSEDIADKSPYFRSKDHKGPQPCLESLKHWWETTKATTSFSRGRRKVGDSRSGCARFHWPCNFACKYTKLFSSSGLFTLFVMLENRWRLRNEGCFASRFALIWPSMSVKTSKLRPWADRQVSQSDFDREEYVGNVFYTIQYFPEILCFDNSGNILVFESVK